jgi:hypothetical protein
MYITGQKAGAAAGTLQAPIVAKAGEATLRVFRAPGELAGPLRTGDYSGVAIDPADGSFWAANEYTTTAVFPPPPGTRLANWGTWVSQFTVSATNSIMAAAAPSVAQGARSSGATVGILLSFADPLVTIAAANTDSAVPANGVSENRTALIVFTPDSGAAQIAGETIGVLYSQAVDSATGDSSLTWLDREFLDDLNLAWI